MTGAAAAPPLLQAHGGTTAFGVALLACLAALIAWSPGGLVWLRTAWFDACQVASPREVASTPVTVVEIDERSLADLGQWPWPRTVLAGLLREIQRHQPAAIGVDIVMPEPDRLSPERLLPSVRERDPALARALDALPRSDGELASAIAAAPVVLGFAGTPERTGREPMAPPIVVIDRDGPDGGAGDVAADLPRLSGALVSLPELDRAARGHGLLSTAPGDDVVRRVPLAARVGERLVPGFAIEILRVALRAPELRLYARGPAVEAVAVDRFVAPTESDGELRLHYSKRDPRRRVSAVDVLGGRVDASRLQQKLVLIGVTGIGLVDWQLTSIGERMPGSEVHAQVLENLFDQSWLMRPAYARWVELALFAVLGALLVWVTPRWTPGRASLLATAVIVLPVAAAFAAFVWLRLVFDAAVPAVALLVLFGALLARTLAEAAQQRKALERAVQRQREQAAYVAGELEAARRIQSGFLPRREILGNESRVDIAAAMTPAREVGGDLYDYFRLDADRIFFLVGDVAGKGLSASLFMAVGKALYKSIALRSPRSPVSEMMSAASEEIGRDNPEMFFVTAFAGILDLGSGVLEYCNAGHDDPWLRSATEPVVTRLGDGAGPPLCAVEGFAYRSGTYRMRPDELLCIVTDGVGDAQNRTGERYGSGRLQAVLARGVAGKAGARGVADGTDARDAADAAGTRGIATAGPGGVTAPNDARDLVDAIRADVASFVQGAEPADDLTVLVVRWRGSDASPCAGKGPAPSER